MRRMMLAAMVACLFVMVAGCAGPRPEVKAARVKLYLDEAGRRIPEQHIPVFDVTEQDAVDRLAGFFPEMGRGIDSNRAAGWTKGAQVDFTTKKGEVIQIAVSHNFDMWNERQTEGDFHTDPKLEGLLMSMARERGLLPVEMPVKLAGTEVASAKVTMHIDVTGTAMGVGKRRTFVVRSDLDLAEMLAYLKGAGEKRTSGDAGGWAHGMDITFRLANGKELEIAISEDFTWWSEGVGAWPLDPMFKSFMAGVWERATQAGDGGSGAGE